MYSKFDVMENFFFLHSTLFNGSKYNIYLMFYACVWRFDVTENLKIFAKNYQGTKPAPTRCRHCHSSAIHQIAASGKRRRRWAGTSEAVTRPPPRQTDTRTHLTSRTSTVYGRSLVRSYCSRSTLRSPGHSRELRRTVRTQKSRHRGSVLCFGTTRNSANGSQRQYYSSLYK
jgi:hypothetical protein